MLKYVATIYMVNVTVSGVGRKAPFGKVEIKSILSIAETLYRQGFQKN